MKAKTKIENNEYAGFPSLILTSSRANLCTPYLHVGTIAWLKTKDLEVRQARLESILWEKSCDRYARAKYEWKVAGLKEHYYSYGREVGRLSLGILYETEDDAQHGGTESLNGKGAISQTDSINIASLLASKYNGFSLENNIEIEGCFGNILEIKCYAILKDGVIERRATEFDLYADRSGVHINLPRVDDCRRFITYEDALSHFKPKKVYTFDDEGNAPTEEEDKTITLKVEIKEKDVEKIKKFITIK